MRRFLPFCLMSCLVLPLSAAAETEAPPVEGQPARAPIEIRPEDLRTFVAVLRAVKDGYVDPVDDQTLLKGAIAGVLNDLDPHSAFLSADELQALGRLVNSYLDLAEDRAQRRMPMTMEDWATQLDKFLDLTERGILKNAGRVSAEAAKTHAVSEFQRYRLVQERDYESDFDRVVKREGPSKEDSLKALEEIERQGKGRKRKPE